MRTIAVANKKGRIALKRYKIVTHKVKKDKTTKSRFKNMNKLTAKKNTCSS